MLKSLVSIGAISNADCEAFLASVSTISRRLSHDRATFERASFLKEYGHLRPGTYDILSPRYDEAPDRYFDWSQPPEQPEAAEPFSLRLNQLRSISELLSHHNLNIDPVGLFDFMQRVIELRELAKFRFTRNLSDVLSIITSLGEELGFTREDISFSDILTFKELHLSAGDVKDALRKSIEVGRERYEATRRLSLPPIITKPSDVWAFEWPEFTPTFVTHATVEAPIRSLERLDELDGAIVCIPNADPGYDWVLSYPIAALITAWGGANSHMAIRASELRLPAVIGVGEIMYKKWTAAERLFLDCAGKRVEVVS